MKSDEYYMRLALSLARKAEGRTSPNPLVGAVVVKNGRVTGKGYHERAGLPHAEAIALKSSGAAAAGSTLYVTLEPCDHYGRTPPCTDAIIAGRVKRVVVGMMDPNPINNGRGIRKLKSFGIPVTVGLLEEEARAINKPYAKYITRRMPYVTIKMAQSLDGKIAARSGGSRWISGEDSRAFVHKLRSKADAVMIGFNTAVKDDPLLLSNVSAAKQPARIILDDKLRLPLGSKIMRSAGSSPVIIVTTSNSPRAEKYEKSGAEVLRAGTRRGRADLKDLLKRLAARGIINILAEGGGELAASLLEEGLADRILFFIAPRIIGGRGVITSVEGDGVKFMKDAIRLKNMTPTRFKDDILIEAEVA